MPLMLAPCMQGGTRFCWATMLMWDAEVLLQCSLCTHCKMNLHLYITNPGSTPFPLPHPSPHRRLEQGDVLNVSLLYLAGFILAQLRAARKCAPKKRQQALSHSPYCGLATGHVACLSNQSTMATTPPQQPNDGGCAQHKLYVHLEMSLSAKCIDTTAIPDKRATP
ncbi:unnamed protein product [Ostreobium quekettii]|uniref:Uncharacterized protein n=1 Tax=Ostreobium quekettii TaxID=121088 RepID=A0A8S1J3I3_9CHLO|nr:unnamed protein product [Ostreobium quekettii]